MKVTDPEVLRLIESLILKMQNLAQKATKPDQKERAEYALKYLQALAAAVLENKQIFGVEPWHPMKDGLALNHAGELLLRVKDSNGVALSPYPAIMTFYHNGFTAEIDTVICLCALMQFRQGNEKQISINVSGRSLHDPAFVKTVLSRVEAMNLGDDEKVLLEIHESNAVVKINQNVLDLFRNFGVSFAIDDVGLSMNDVFRLSAFEKMADYIKLDRQSVRAHPQNPHSVGHVLSLTSSFLPKAFVVAEGVQSAEHAHQLVNDSPNIHYVQGLYLPGRDEFRQQLREFYTGRRGAEEKKIEEAE